MTLNQLLYFQTIATYQHFRQAATVLNLSQPSLSQSISSLEEELGIPLFERQGRNVRLTKYGKIFLEHADSVLREVRFAKEHMKQLANNQGHVDIAYVFPLADYYIPHIVRKFLQQEENKNITFSFRQNHTTDMIAGLKSDRYDVIFGSYVKDEPDIEFIPIIHQEIVVITPKGHPLTKLEAVPLKDLEQFPVIGYEYTSGLGKFTKEIYASYGLSPNIVCESPDENAISSLVAEEFGIALVANVDLLKKKNVCILPIAGSPLQHTVYLAYRKDRYQIHSVKNFIRFIQEYGTQL